MKKVKTIGWGKFARLWAACLICLTLTPAGYAASDPPVGMNSPAGASVVLSPEAGYLPSSISFDLGSGPLKVLVTDAHWVHKGRVSRADFPPVSTVGLDASAKVYFSQGDPVGLGVSLSPSAPAIRLRMTGAGAALRLTGADRVVAGSGGRFQSVVLSEGGIDLPLSANPIIVMNGTTQEGLVIRPGSASDGWRLKGSGDKLILASPATSSTKSLVLQGFCGDSLLALERAGGMDSAWAEASRAPAQTAGEGPLGPPLAEAEIGPETVDWTFWPDKGRVFGLLKADPREALFRLGFMVNDHGHVLEDINIGGDMGLLYRQWASDHKLSVTARGLFTARFDFDSESFDLQNMDFIGGPAVGYQLGRHFFEFFVYHQSSHLGDEPLDFGLRQRIDYARETVRFLYAYKWPFGLRLYAGPSFHLHALPRDLQHKLVLQGGGDYNFTVYGQPVYAAVDLQSRQENDWSMNTTFQMGVDLGDPKATRNRQFVFFEAFQGNSNMGQFWDEWESYQLLGVGYQFR